MFREKTCSGLQASPTSADRQARTRRYLFFGAGRNQSLTTTSTVNMDVDELISQVFRRVPIWDKRLKQHANRVYVDKCWKEIALEMKTEGKHI